MIRLVPIGRTACFCLLSWLYSGSRPAYIVRERERGEREIWKTKNKLRSIYLSSSVRDGLDGVGVSLADLDLARDEARQGGADGPRRPRGQLMLLVQLLLVGTGRQQGRRVRQRRLLHQQRRRGARQSQVPSIEREKSIKFYDIWNRWLSAPLNGFKLKRKEKGRGGERLFVD